MFHFRSEAGEYVGGTSGQTENLHGAFKRSDTKAQFRGEIPGERRLLTEKHEEPHFRRAAEEYGG